MEVALISNLGDLVLCKNLCRTDIKKDASAARLSSSSYRSEAVFLPCRVKGPAEAFVLD